MKRSPARRGWHSATRTSCSRRVITGGSSTNDVAGPVPETTPRSTTRTADATLAAAEIWLARQNSDQRSRILTKRLNLMQVSRRYEYVIIDCGPSLNLLNQNALSYVDEVIIPVTCDYLALVGVKQVLRTIKDVERHLGHAVRISAVLPTFYENRVRRSLGPLWEALPEGALMHDQNAYLKSQESTPPLPATKRVKLFQTAAE